MAAEASVSVAKKNLALQAALALGAACSAPARIVIAGDDEFLTPILEALNYSTLEDAGSDVAACVVSGPVPFQELEKAVASVAPTGFVVFGKGDIAEGDLASLGLTLVPVPPTDMRAPVLLAVKGGDALQRTVSSGFSSESPAVRTERDSALDDLEQRLNERLDRLIFQNTQMINSLDRLTHAVSLKSRLVSVLRRTGTLETVALVMARARRMRGGLAQRRKASGPIMQLAPGVSVAGPIAIASSAPAADEIETSAKPKQIDVIRLRPAVRVKDQTVSMLGRPEIDSLGGWLALSDPQHISSIKTFMIDLDEGGVALNLLRGRLSPDQALLLIGSSNRQALPPELGRPDLVRGPLSFYASAPDVLCAASSDGAAQTRDGHGERNWPKISMVMVSFNQAAFLEEGIRSILDQNYPNLEFILIDGGSKDGSADIIERYRDRLDKVVIEPDRGQSDGLNKGFDLATGEILSWLNSDDLLLPGALAKVATAFSVYGADMIAGGCKQVQEDGKTIVVSHHNHLPLGQAVPLPLNELLDFDNRWQGGAFFYQPEVFFSRDIWLRSGGGLRLDLYYVLDYDLWIRMAAAGAKIAHIPDFLAASRIHDQQKTTFGENPFIPETRKLLAEYASGVRWTRPSGA